MNAIFSIYQKPGPFVFFVWDGTRLLFIGGTEDINKKSFRFDFEYTDITGYYYTHPDFLDEIDRRIVEWNPLYNSRLRSSYTKKMAIKKFCEVFQAKGISCGKKEKTRFWDYLKIDSDGMEFDGEIYYTSTDVNIAIEQMRADYGIHGFES